MGVAERAELIRRTLKEVCWALHSSEQFGETRILRVLTAWAETRKETKNDPDAILMIEYALDKICPSRMITRTLGKTKIDLTPKRRKK